MLYEKLVRPLLFRMDPERAHEMMVSILAATQEIPFGTSMIGYCLGKPVSGLETQAFGLSFPNPIGLAAGFDKDSRLTRVLPALGFGFIEAGSVTLKPQSGNPKPRMFRLPEYSAIVNRLGFNSNGAEVVAERLKRLETHAVPLGINLGLNADCPKEAAPARYAETFRLLEPFGDYFAVNVSSPNTAGLRELQESRHLESVLASIQAQNDKRKPLLVKISPDLSEAQLEDAIEVILRSASGVIATNTTISREGLPASAAELQGGLSGAPLKARSTGLIRRIRRLTSGKLPIIGVGGVFTGADAFEKIRAGASLVQLYTGLIYGGPSAVLRIGAELAELLARSGFKTVSAAVGSEAQEARA